MQVFPAIRVHRSDLLVGIPVIDPAMIDHIQWKGRRIEILRTTDDSRLVTELDDEDE